MKILFSELKKKDVIDLCTGKRLGKIRDVEFTFPEGRVVNFTVGGGVCSNPTTLALCNVEKIGKDAVLVKTKGKDVGACPGEGCEKKPLPDKGVPHERFASDGGVRGRGGYREAGSSFFGDEE